MDPLLMWGLALLGSAVLLLVIEAFVPSGGIIGLVAVVVAGAGVTALFRYETAWGVSGLLGVVVMVPAFVWFMFKIFPDTPMGRLLILGGRRDDDDAPRLRTDPREALLGETAEVIQPLRPVGAVRVNGERHEAVSDTGVIIEPPAMVKIVGLNPHELRVRLVRENA